MALVLEIGASQRGSERWTRNACTRATRSDTNFLVTRKDLLTMLVRVYIMITNLISNLHAAVVTLRLGAALLVGSLMELLLFSAATHNHFKFQNLNYKTILE